MPLFLTVTRISGEGEHTDVSLWYLFDADTITSYDEDEFDAIRWLTVEQVIEEPGESLDPHVHRFTHKLRHARAARHDGRPRRRHDGRPRR
ncbi:hypothetical protein [Streptomyces sp. NK15101]|uniref:hypothetical protein n=1 Tax=Streptomyces sp. NK15101 TaxID=2873261 RepID=UPI001CEC2831|nr:hypothetical protein [Streptomyces sp. NK15101]